MIPMLLLFFSAKKKKEEYFACCGGDTLDCLHFVDDIVVEAEKIKKSEEGNTGAHCRDHNNNFTKEKLVQWDVNTVFILHPAGGGTQQIAKGYTLQE